MKAISMRFYLNVLRSKPQGEINNLNIQLRRFLTKKPEKMTYVKRKKWLK